MDALNWQGAIHHIRPYIVRVSTPGGFGTGFLFAYTANGAFCGIATAAHVVQHAHSWEQPIRIQHHASGYELSLRPAQRGVLLEEGIDTAAIVFPGDPNLPRGLPDLLEEGNFIQQGVEVGWMGFPQIQSHALCFFSGRISAWDKQSGGYFIDGVAIHGVSGGPAVFLEGPKAHVIGVVSAYLPNQTTGGALPGLCFISGLSQLQRSIKALKNLEEVQEKQSSAESKQFDPAP